jgi:diacylglycerol kinase family enzyme
VHLAVVYNPKAGSHGWPSEAIQERLESAGHEPVLVSSQSDWRASLAEPAEAFVAAGGDGTVHQLARALAGSDRPLAIIPLGTANNIARAFGYAPGSDPFARAARWGEQERTLFIECARSGSESLPFLEVLGAGAFARLLARRHAKKKRLPLANLMAARRRLLDEVMEGPVLDAEVALDGRPVEGRYVMLGCLRMPSFGPALWLAPDQRPDERSLTLVGVRNDQREALAWWLATGEGDVGSFRLGTGIHVELTADGPIHVDDHLFEAQDGRRRTITAGEIGRTVRVLV